MNKRLKTTPKNRLKIGFVYDDSLDKTDGVAQYIKTLGKWLSNRGHEVLYLAGESELKSWSGGRVYSMTKNINVSFNANRLSTPRPSNRRLISKVLSDEKFDILHVQIPYSPFMAQRVIDSAGASVIVGTFHILPAGRMAAASTSLLKLIYGQSLGKFTEFISVSQSAAEFAEKTLKIKSHILPNAVDVKSFRSAPNTASGPKKIVFLGRLVARKGAIYLLKAFAELTKTDEEVELVIGGDGPQRHKLEKFVNSKNLNHRVAFLGFVPEENKAKLLKSASIACFPALYGESFGIVLIEAMSASDGVVVGGDNPGYRCVLDGDMLIDPKDTKSFTRYLQKILNDRFLASSLRRRQQAIVKRYDINVVGPKVEKLYIGAVAKSRKSSNNE